MSEPQTAAPPEHSVKTPTEYVVLEQVGITDAVPPEKGWRVVGRFTAKTPKAAMEAFVASKGQGGKSDAVPILVAVASKYWSPFKPKADVVTTWTFEAAP